MILVVRQVRGERQAVPHAVAGLHPSEGDFSCDGPANDGCTDAEETALGDDFDPVAWYDVYDVPVPANADADGANGFRDKVVDIGGVLAALAQAFVVDCTAP